MHHLTWGGEEIWILPQKALLFPVHKTLVVSDLHLSKTGHFRKSGIPIPQKVYIEDLQRLFSLVQENKTEHLLVAGDFFHSHANIELNLFSRWRNDFSSLKISLIIGNHDILGNEWYLKNKIDIYNENLFTLNKISFIHDIAELKDEKESSNRFLISGHLHPGIHIGGKGRQGLTFPCFYFSKNHVLLPAFSKFSGLAMIRPKKGDNVFAIVNDKIILI